jgi:para-aminobenzoate synthetase component 1
VQPLETRERYVEKVLRAKEQILDGEIYQVNLSHTCRYAGIHDPFSLYRQLIDHNPVPFSAYLNIDSRFSIVSLSPERLLRHERGVLETRPIKGTAPRGQNAEEDQAERANLLASPKERAELMMITDLMRNDLGMVSKAGSVLTPELCVCEAYASVYHLHSVIRSQAKESLHPLDLLGAAFPGGSISGCPKSSAMRTIRELEQRPRGIYTGSIGYIRGNGDFDFNIAIRTLAVEGDTAMLSLGGGIVADSDPHLEYEETLHKGRPFFRSLRPLAEETSTC